MKTEYNSLSWKELSELDKNRTIIIFPVGSTEQHGPHLPLKTDCFISKKLSDIIAIRASKTLNLNVFVLPELCYGLSSHWMPYTGTITLSMSTYSMVIKEVIDSLEKHGFTNILILNGHGGNTGTLVTLADEIVYQKKNLKIIVSEWWKMVDANVIKGLGFKHADDLETSVYLALGGEMITEPKPQEPSAWPYKWKTEGGAEANIFMAHKIVGSGMFGEGWKARLETGQKIVDSVIQNYLSLIREVFVAE